VSGERSRLRATGQTDEGRCLAWGSPRPLDPLGPRSQFPAASAPAHGTPARLSSNIAVRTSRDGRHTAPPSLRPSWLRQSQACFPHTPAVDLAAASVSTWAVPRGAATAVQALRGHNALVSRAIVWVLGFVLVTGIFGTVYLMEQQSLRASANTEPAAVAAREVQLLAAGSGNLSEQRVELSADSGPFVVV
jgi:hypothetical protein